MEASGRVGAGLDSLVYPISCGAETTHSCRKMRITIRRILRLRPFTFPLHHAYHPFQMTPPRRFSLTGKLPTMSLTDLARRLFCKGASFQRLPPPQNVNRTRRARLDMITLEDRTVPTVITATPLSPAAEPSTVGYVRISADSTVSSTNTSSSTSAAPPVSASTSTPARSPPSRPGIRLSICPSRRSTTIRRQAR